MSKPYLSSELLHVASYWQRHLFLLVHIGDLVVHLQRLLEVCVVEELVEESQILRLVCIAELTLNVLQVG